MNISNLILAKEFNTTMFNSLTQNEKLAIEMAKEGSVSGKLVEWPYLHSALFQMGFDLNSNTNQYFLKRLCRFIWSLINESIEILSANQLYFTEKIAYIDGLEEFNTIYYLDYISLDFHQIFNPDFGDQKLSTDFLKQQGYRIIRH